MRHRDKTVLVWFFEQKPFIKASVMWTKIAKQFYQQLSFIPLSLYWPIVNQDQYLFTDEPVFSQDLNNSYPICFEERKDKYNLQNFDNGSKINLSPRADNNYSPKCTISSRNRYRQKHFRKRKSFVVSWPLLYDTDVDSEYDSSNGGRVPTPKEKNYSHLELYKFTNYHLE